MPPNIFYINYIHYSLGVSVKTALLFLFVLALAICGFYFCGILHFDAAQAETNVGGLITSSTTWTKANSPYILTGPVAVNTGVTLTIEPGAFVNLNNYYIQVNGTLIAKGTSTEQVSIYWGKIIYTSFSNGWNDSTSSGCIIENAVLYYAEISSSNPLKISNSTSNKPITAGDSSIITYSNIDPYIEPDVHVPYIISVGSSSIISHNNLHGQLYIGSSSEISYNNFTWYSYLYIQEASVITNNIINGAVDSQGAGSITFINNTVDARDLSYGVWMSGIASNNNILGDFWAGGTILNNTVAGEIRGGSIISYNMVYGPINTAGNPTITYNNCTGIGVGLDSSSVVIAHNNIFNRGGIYMGPPSWPYLGGICYNATISDNNASYIGFNSDSTINATIERNIITFGSDGVFLGAKATVMVVNNTIAFNNVGIRLDAGAASPVINNTFAFNNIGIRLGSSSQNISYNNFQNTSGYNIYLSSGATGKVNVTDNWWGTTDTQAINQSMYDSKNDFNVGTVNFVPFLTAPNSAAPTIPMFNILASAGAGGSINPSGSISVPYGGNQTFTITADTGYQIVDVLVDGSSVGVGSSYNFTNVQADHTISATFAPTPTPTPSPSPTPTPTPTPSPSPSPNPSPSPTATPTPTPTPTPTSSPTPTPTSSPTATPSPNSSPQPTATASPTPPPDTGINLSTPLAYAIAIAFITLIAIITALIIKRKK
jgi:parallel beta-helix repeat protein